MKDLCSILGALALACFTAAANGRAIGYGSPLEFIKPYKRQALQDVVSVFDLSGECQADRPKVTWDKDTIFVNGERLFLYSGEVHPFRYNLFRSASTSQVILLTLC